MESDPEGFEVSQATEEDLGAEGYTYIQGLPLSKLHTKANEIFERRAQQVASILLKTQQASLFGDEETDGLQLVSCGLLCGK